MKTAGVVAGIGIVVAGIGGLGMLMWWNAEITDAKFEAEACLVAQHRHNFPVRCELKDLQSNGAGGKIGWMTVEYNREPFVWFHDMPQLNASGVFKEKVQVAAPVLMGNLSSFTRPKFGAPLVTTDFHGDPKDFWKQLETEPENAAFDALQADVGTGAGAVVYLSALRRLEKWDMAVAFVPRFWHESVRLRMGEEDFLARELDLIDRAPLSPNNRKSFDKTLHELWKRDGWSPVKKAFDKRMASRIAK